MTNDWWAKPRGVSVVVDNESWILPHAQGLVDALNERGDRAALCRGHGDMAEGAVAFFLGCIHIAGPEVLALNRRNLVVHESDLPKGRGFSPLTWQILEGRDRIEVCLFEAVAEADAGPVISRDHLDFEGHELIGEMRTALGRKTVEMCLRFLGEAVPPAGVPQEGEPSAYPRRTPGDSRLDPDATIAGQFGLLRVVDNVRYPAYFDLKGQRYRITIEKAGPASDDGDAGDESGG